MGLTTTTNRYSYSGNGSTKAFSFPAYFAKTADLVVIKTSALGVESTLVEGSAYSVSGTTVDGVYKNGGTVTLVTAPAVGESLLIYRNPTLTQDLDLLENDSLPAEEVEKALDKVMMVCQRISEKADRSIGISDTDDGSISLKLPAKATRASKFMAFDASGSPIASSGGIDGSKTVSSFGETLIDDADAATARTTLGMGSTSALRALLGFGGTDKFVKAGDISSDFIRETTNAKTTPISSDVFLMADSEASFEAKKVTLASLMSQLDLSRNLLLNSDFGIWQRGTSTTITNSNAAYLADRWYAKNSLGTNGVLTYSRVAASEYGSLYGAKVQITTAPTASQANGCELYQTLAFSDFKQFYSADKKVSFSAKLKAFGNVTALGIAVMYKTSEAKVDTVLGSEVVVSVNSSNFTLGQLESQLLGTSMGASGVIGVRIRILTVSSGNLYDINNGFAVETPMLNIGPLAPWRRQFLSFGEEFHACQRFFEKSYDLDTAPATVTNAGAYGCRASGASAEEHIFFAARKRTTPTITLYNSNSGASGSWRSITGPADVNFSAADVGELGFNADSTGTTDGHIIKGHWTADAEI